MTTLTKYPANIQAIMEDFAQDPDIKALALEPHFPTTQNSYGLYMERLTKLASLCPLLGDQTADLRFWADVLVHAGGNQDGIASALKILT